MVHQTVKISTPAGLTLQRAGVLCEKAVEFQSAVRIRKGQSLTNAKSLLAVLGACIQFGDEVEFSCEGPDEKEALAAMVRLINEL